MMRSLPGIVLAAALTAILTAITTWPQVLDPAGRVLGHHDTYFSMWRLGWIAHALRTAPTTILDGNIFYPATRTLTYSDAMLLEGVIAAPLLWAGLNAQIVYNIMLGLGFVGSGVAMFVLARHLTGQSGPALVAAAIFTAAPYRTEHLMHLELQWTMWMPLTLWAIHLAIDRASWRWGALVGVCFALQVLSCVYYGVFLAMLLCVIVPLALITGAPRTAKAIPALAIAGVVALMLVLPYAWQYVQASRELGTRDMSEVARYSATPMNYLSSPGASRVWGWTERWGDRETRLFPGLMSILLTLASVASRARRQVIVYGIAAACAVLLSFGVNNSLYRWAFDHVTLLQGLRSSSRFGILVVGMLSVLAAFGTQVILERTRRHTMVLAAMLLLIAVDTSNRPFTLSDDLAVRPAPVYKVIRSAPPGVVAEVPLPRTSSLPGWDAYYAVWSMQHWRPLLNGYSGYYPRDYMQTMVRMESFPDAPSVARLRAHHVRYLVVHKAFMDPERYAAVMLRLAGRPEFKPWGSFDAPIGTADIFELTR